MALPKEPRQKMINIMYLVLTALLALNVSAEILNAFKTVNTSLENSIKTTDGSNTLLFGQLSAKLADAKTHDKAAIYAPLAANAQTLCDKVYKDIDAWKDSLKLASGLNPAKGDTVMNDGDIEAATNLFIEHNNGQTLKNELVTLKQDLLNISPEINREFSNKLPIDVTPPKSQSGNHNDSWEYSYFHMTPTIAALTILSKFQNDIKNSENKIVTYCNNQINSVSVIYDKFAPLLSQSSEYVMPGQQVTIKAGVGAFSSAALPSITIGGETVPSADGYGTKVITTGGPGNMTVPVHISFKDQNGKDVSIDDKVEYTVGQPSGASVSATKMNVFYIGVDNPVAISPGTGWDKATAGFSGQGSMTGSGNDRIVRVTGGTEATINVVADGKASPPFKFRVKTIPDPIGMVGPSKGGRIQSNIFKAQDFLRAELLNFDFEARFTIVSSTVYFAGAGFTDGVKTGSIGSGGSFGSIRTSLDRCKPGSTVTFDDLKVVGPDGRSRVIPPVTFVLF